MNTSIARTDPAEMQRARSPAEVILHAPLLCGEKFDFVIAGGGLAGLSLGLQLFNNLLRNRSILIVEREAKDRANRT